MPRPKVDPVVLSDVERSLLARWVRRLKTAQALVLQSRIAVAPNTATAALTRLRGSTRPTRPAINSTTASNDATHPTRSTTR